jgi:hypothetical protein
MSLRVYWLSYAMCNVQCFSMEGKKTQATSPETAASGTEAGVEYQLSSEM